ncbi:MAG: flagellar protein FlaG [Synergistaceae bacterium]|nr:flagellar protein FlaG [Synergistaceae bacterium]
MQAGCINNVPTPQQSPVERQHQVVKTKTLGNPGGGEVSNETIRRKLEERQRHSQQENQEQKEQHAEKIQAAILEREGRMRHLKFDVIDDAAIVQVSVINSEDGTIVRKVPSDEMVKFVRMLRRKLRNSGASNLLDIQA